MGIEATFKRLNVWLESWPSGVLTILLLVAALALVVIALRGSAIEKAITLTYVVFP